MPAGSTNESVLRAMVRSLRPRQWVKNLLVLAAPLAAGALPHSQIWPRVLGGLVAFLAVSCGIYLVNDLRDVDEDRRHPTKRYRPIAMGSLPPRVAWMLAAVLLTAGLGGGFVIRWQLGATLLVYVTVQAAYSLGLKHQPVLDLAVVASGFLLRAIAGGTATGIPLSQWFLLVAAFGSLFMVAGKRYSEMHSIGADAGTRRSLSHYSASYLRFVWTLAASGTLIFYGLWAFENDVDSWAAISIAPVTLGVLRYAADIDRGVAGSPEEIVLRDRVLQVIVAAWVVLVIVNAWKGSA